MFKQQQQPPSKTDKTTIKQVVDLIQCQDLKFQARTDMVASMMISSKTTGTGKRTPEEFYESDNVLNHQSS
jgi:hypothetical protein